MKKTILLRALFLLALVAGALSTHAQAYEYECVKNNSASESWIAQIYWLEEIEVQKDVILFFDIIGFPDYWKMRWKIVDRRSSSKNTGKDEVNEKSTIDLFLTNGQHITFKNLYSYSEYSHGERRIDYYMNDYEILLNNKTFLNNKYQLPGYAMALLRSYNITKMVFNGVSILTPKFRSADTFDAMCKSLISKTGEYGQYGTSLLEEFVPNDRKPIIANSSHSQQGERISTDTEVSLIDIFSALSSALDSMEKDETLKVNTTSEKETSKQATSSTTVKRAAAKSTKDSVDSMMVASSQRRTTAAGPSTNTKPATTTKKQPAKNATTAVTQRADNSTGVISMTLHQLVMQPLGVLPQKSQHMKSNDIMDFLNTNYPQWASRLYSGGEMIGPLNSKYNMSWKGIIPSASCRFNSEGVFNKYTMRLTLPKAEFTPDEAESFFEGLKSDMNKEGINMNLNAAKNGWKAVLSDRIVALRKEKYSESTDIVIDVWFTDENGKTY